MSVDVSKIKQGDTVRLDVPNGSALTGVVSEHDGELGIRFGGSWFVLSRWVYQGVTLVESAEPEQPEWADALVVRDADGKYHTKVRDGMWADGGINVSFDMLPQPITVVIDEDGTNIDARDIHVSWEQACEGWRKRAEAAEEELDSLHCRLAIINEAFFNALNPGRESEASK